MKLTQEIKLSLQKTQKVISIQMDVHHINTFVKIFKKFIFPGSRWQQEQQNNKSINTTFQEPFPENLQEFIKENNCQILQKEVIVGYEDMTYNEVLQKLLPQNVSAPQGYEIIGKIAHFNLSPEQLPYRYLIGQVLLDKNKHLQTVCNKLEKLHNVYRTPQLELLAGKNSYDAIVPEGGIRLFLNFEKVYWCTRLYSERERIIKFIKELSNGQKIKVLDLFCGIGPFSIRIAKDLNANCLANDLNPECFNYLQKNIVENKVQNQVIPLNMDAREVVLKIYDKEIDFDFNHVYMNLPVLALNFLDVFKGFTQKTGKQDLPYIHVYGFAKGKDDQELIEQFSQRIIKGLPGFDKSQILRFHILKNVTKMKKMCCLSFQLDKKSAESDFGLLEQDDGNNSDFEDDEKVEQNEQVEEVINKKVKIE
ncbi:unnamed protein product [Paramecium primaurelia]|uniref:tRNA (guanine(37)-N1)-methyltransferase n=1 Tax=Paramecium primaurelia TaxID=5886 RepID=A0A8S1Q0L6_PARPR|nr:unnamed protein product [Paramecium primaurelia]